MTNIGVDDRSHYWTEFRDAFLMNQGVWALYQRFTFQVIQAGHKRYGSFGIMNQIRWHTTVVSTGSEFKVCNNWGPYLSRVFSWKYPQHGPSCWQDPITQRPWGVPKPEVNDGFFSLKTVSTHFEVEYDLFRRVKWTEPSSR